jgi:two-component system, OmpR family, sensor histidine kinase MtrB
VTRSRPQPPERRRGLRLRTRLMLIFTLGALFLSASLAIITYERSRSYLVRNRETSLQQQTFVNARLMRARLREPGADPAALLASLDLPTASSEQVLRAGGNWFSTDERLGVEVVPPGVLEAVAAGHAAKQRFGSEDGVPRLAVGVPMIDVGAQYFAVYPLRRLSDTLNVLRNSLLLGSVFTTVAGALAGVWTSRRVLRPLADVSAAAASVAAGRFDIRLQGGSDPDLATVATSFNHMTDALQRRIRRDARFASAVSHELRSPLATLVNSVEVMLTRRSDLPERSRTAVDLLAAEVRRFQRLVEDLLEMSRLDAGADVLEMEDVRLGEFVVHAAAATGVGKEVVVVADDARRAVINADKRRLERVVANLVENAVNHGGGVARVAVETHGASARICVEDRGPGVPEAEREVIFEPFVRGGANGRRSAGGGAGLGLSLVSEHVRLHSGRVWVEDGADGGARFVVELPVAAGAGSGNGPA